jgi:hypothetical protein
VDNPKTPASPSRISHYCPLMGLANERDSMPARRRHLAGWQNVAPLSRSARPDTKTVATTGPVYPFGQLG